MIVSAVPVAGLAGRGSEHQLRGGFGRVVQDAGVGVGREHDAGLPELRPLHLEIDARAGRVQMFTPGL